MTNNKSAVDKLLPYVVGAMFTLFAFLSKQVYNELSSKPSEAEVKVIIENRITPLEDSLKTSINKNKNEINSNKNEITAFQVALENLVIVNTGIGATLIRIDDRTIKQGADIAEIKGIIKQLD